MAPRNPAVDTGSKAVATTTKNSDRVAKRPARGYHRFRNGMLNMAPKGQEKDLVATNRVSPLLALPAEIRNRIYHYALGGKTFRLCYMSSGRSFRCEPSERVHAFALLRTCRQIYAETAAMPCVSNTFSVPVFYGRRLQRSCRLLTKYQISHITELQIELPNAVPNMGPEGLLERMLSSSKLAVVSELRRIRVLVFPIGSNVSNEQAFVRYEAMCRLQCEEYIQSKGYELVFKLMNVTYNTFELKWFGTPEVAPG